MSDALDKRIKNVMSAIFDIAENQINKDSSPDTIESWDSFRQDALDWLDHYTDKFAPC